MTTYGMSDHLQLKLVHGLETEFPSLWRNESASLSSSTTSDAQYVQY